MPSAAAIPIRRTRFATYRRSHDIEEAPGLVAWLVTSREMLTPEDVLDKGPEAVALKIVGAY